ncbi:hypothetical protein K7X08_028170 [Anisodus acutangulus]|uniref:FBD domain-containing protein n=1 Tax=Anisodus acutangulus TaxID=402998 RepID=A0A9Q1N094_9SOLA|nr:hypothetical protein K7X08_028170 [Anisodus acutangulus]
MFGIVEVLDITNVASIVEVSVNRVEKFDFRQYKDYQEMRIFLQTVTGAKSLKLCSWFALVFSSWQLKNLPSPTFSCKSLQLHLDFVKWHLPGILNLLKQCPCLEKLMIEVTSYYESTSRNTLSWIHPYEFDADEYWNMVDTPVQCLSQHLKTVEVAGHVMEKQVIQFLEYLLGHSMVLEEMMIFMEKQTWNYVSINGMSNKAHEYEERLMNEPKASASAAVFFY